MRWKNITLTVVVATLVIAGLDLALRPNPKALQSSAFDPFTDPYVIEKQEYASTELARALIGLDPVVPGHCLIIPKRRVMRFEELTGEEILEISYLIKRTHEATEAILGPCDYIILQKNGASVGQTVPHVHWHYLPRLQGQKSVLRFAINFIHPFHRRLSDHQMAERRQQMQHTLDMQTHAALPIFEGIENADLAKC